MDGINYDLTLSNVQRNIKRIRNYGNETIYNYKTEIVENINEKQFTDEQRARLIKLLEDNERISKIQKQLLSDTQLHQFANQCLQRAEIALPIRSGPWPYDVDLASKMMDELVNKEKQLRISYLSYNIQFNPLEFVGDLPNANDRIQLCEFTIIPHRDIFKTIYPSNPNNLKIKANWQWKTYPTEHVSGIGDFRIMIMDEHDDILHQDEWMDMLMYDVYSYTMTFIVQTRISSVLTDRMVNDDIEWSPYNVSNESFTSNVIGAYHISKSKLVIAKNAANFLPPVILTDTLISDMITYQNDQPLTKDVIPVATQDSYLQIKIGMGVHPTSLEEIPDNDDDNEKILLSVMESDLEDRCRHDSMKIAKMLELAYYAQWQRDEQMFLDLNVGLDSGIFTNFGSQIATLYKMVLRTLQYEPFETEIEPFTHTEYYPYLLSLGSETKQMHRVFRTGIWWAATTVNEPMGFKWQKRGDYLALTKPFTYTGKSMLSSFEFDEGRTDVITIPLEGAEIIIKYTIVSTPSTVSYTEGTPPFHNFMWQTEELFERDSSNNRHIVFKRVLYPKEWNGYKIMARSGNVKLKIPRVTLTIDRVFISINGSQIEPIMNNFDRKTLTVIVACIEYKTEIVGIRPGQYDTSDGQKKYGFFCDLSQTTFINNNEGKEVDSIMRLPDDDKIWQNEKLDFSFKHQSPEGQGLIFYDLSNFHLNSALGETFSGTGQVGMSGPARPEGIKAQFEGTLTSKLESTSQYIMIKENDNFKIPQLYPEMYERGEKVENTTKWAGRLFGTVLFKTDMSMKISAFVPRPPQPQDQLWIFDEKMDELLASLQMLIANWTRDHETLMNLVNRIDRLEKIVEELVDGSEVQFWVDLVGGLLGFILPDKGIQELASLVGNKLVKGFKGILKRKGNSFSWRIGDSFAKSKYHRLVEVPEVATELVGDYRIAEQTMKDVTAKVTGVPKRIAYATQKWEDVENESIELFEISGKSVFFEQPEYLKATALIHTGLPKPDVLNRAITDNKILELATSNGARVNELPFNTAKFYAVPLDIAGERIGNFFFRFSRKNPNKFDQLAAESFMKNNKRMLHAYTRTEVFVPRPDNKGMMCRVTYAGVQEGISFPVPETNKIWVGAVTFNTDVVGKAKDGWILKLGKFEDSGYSEQDLARLTEYTFGYPHNSMRTDTKWKMVWEKLNRRDIYDAHLYYEHRAADPNRIDAIGRFAEITGENWDYNLLFNNCQNFNRLMYEWTKNGTVPNDAHKQILLNAYIKSLNSDVRAYMTGVVSYINSLGCTQTQLEYILDADNKHLVGIEQ
ncbi:structural protein [Chiqui virus]|uniref:structural protein n=1 Tax=Chiqui virus TaxID=2250219 RepID=UPI000DC79DE1|nr:structural protein [Chiqui virus]AWX66221.1 structural protein [Chiqui virus]